MIAAASTFILVQVGHTPLGDRPQRLMDLTTPLTYVKGIGPGRAAMLEAKGLTTVEDLLGYVPFRYEDRSNMKPIGQLAPGDEHEFSVRAKVTLRAKGARGQFSIFGASEENGEP